MAAAFDKAGFEAVDVHMSDILQNHLSLQNTFSHKLRSLITEYVFTQTQITHYRIRFHTNSDHFVCKRIL
jgi:hypothetical protein